MRKKCAQQCQQAKRVSEVEPPTILMLDTYPEAVVIPCLEPREDEWEQGSPAL
jgi:hypothetical protein